MQSLPFVGAWIEIVRCIERYPKYMSLPSRERGLKWFSLPDHNYIKGSLLWSID